VSVFRTWLREIGGSALDVRQRLVFSGIWMPKFTHSSSAAAKYLVDSWGFSILGVFTAAPQVTPTVQISTAFVPTGFTAAFTGNMNGYANSRVPFLPVNSIPVDQTQKIDARITKYIPIKERFKAAFTFDAFNVFNHRFFTSVNQRTYIATGNVLALQSNAGVGTASQGFPDGTNARRLQIGLRFNW